MVLHGINSFGVSRPALGQGLLDRALSRLPTSFSFDFSAYMGMTGFSPRLFGSMWSYGADRRVGSFFDRFANDLNSRQWGFFPGADLLFGNRDRSEGSQKSEPSQTASPAPASVEGPTSASTAAITDPKPESEEEEDTEEADAAEAPATPATPTAPTPSLDPAVETKKGEWVTKLKKHFDEDDSKLIVDRFAKLGGKWEESLKKAEGRCDNTDTDPRYTSDINEKNKSKRRSLAYEYYVLKNYKNLPSGVEDGKIKEKVREVENLGYAFSDFFDTVDRWPSTL